MPHPSRRSRFLVCSDGTELEIATPADGEYLRVSGSTVVGDTGGSGGAPTSASYVVLGANATLTAERVLAVGTGLDLVDGGAGSTVTIQLDLTEVAAGGDLAGTMDAPTIAAGVVTYAKIQDVSATDKILGRASAGSGDVEEITCTAAGRALLDDANASAQRTTLGLGSLATQDAGAVAITGGSVTGITDVAVADGGTGASTASGARANLGVAAPMLFGLGADGVLDFNGGGGSVGGATLSGSTYTATRDIRASSVTIRSGVTLKMVGFRLFISGTLAIEATGAISNSGSAGSGTSGGASPGTGSPGTIASTATAGGNGRGTSGAGTGTTGTSPSIGGRGGAGGAAAGGSPAGGTAGSITAPTAVQGDLRDYDCLIRGQLRSTSTGYIPADAGSGGGGGGHDGVSGNSGGGGGGGSSLWIVCDTINNAGKIQANGGDGAAATGTDNGGGGGGGGGWILLVYRATAGSGLGTVEAAGGNGGAGSGGGSAGSTGSVGTVYTLQYT